MLDHHSRTEAGRGCIKHQLYQGPGKTAGQARKTNCCSAGAVSRYEQIPARRNLSAVSSFYHIGLKAAQLPSPDVPGPLETSDLAKLRFNKK